MPGSTFFSPREECCLVGPVPSDRWITRFPTRKSLPCSWKSAQIGVSQCLTYARTSTAEKFPSRLACASNRPLTEHCQHCSNLAKTNSNFNNFCDACFQSDSQVARAEWLQPVFGLRPAVRQHSSRLKRIAASCRHMDSDDDNRTGTCGKGVPRSLRDDQTILTFSV